MRTSNPALGPNIFTGFGYADQTMTVQGTVNKSALLLLITIIAATSVWAVSGLSVIGIFASIPAFILAMITVFKQEWARITAPIYALVKGLAITRHFY
jgi:uncharacterized YccA/Bax inhibitor family protein